MNSNQIAGADILDIIFEGRNKAYGAYQLQKAYNYRLGVAISLVLSVVLVSMLFPAFKNQNISIITSLPANDTIQLVNVKPVKPTEPMVQHPPKLAVSHFATIKIVKDIQVIDTIPPMDVVAKTIIGTITETGLSTETNAPAPPVAVVQQPAATDVQQASSIFETAEHPARFPGGSDAWRRYLEKNLHYPDVAIEAETQATIRVQFIVDTEGNISQVHALNDPGDGLAEEAVRIIKNGPKWVPAEQNGLKVIFRHIQTITFRLN